jgi:hypothetical protein
MKLMVWPKHHVSSLACFKDEYGVPQFDVTKNIIIVIFYVQVLIC